MNAKLLAILSVLTIVILAAAMFAYSRRDIGPSEARTDLLYPAPADRINDVQRIDVVTTDASFTLDVTDDRWGLADKHGYPAEFDKIQSMLIGLTQLKIVESKTSNPALYDKIGVNDPEEDDAVSTRVTLHDGEGRELAALVVGNQVFHGRTQRQFVRKAGETQTWLVEGRLPIDKDPLSWLNREILRVPHDRVQSAVITHSDVEPGVEPVLSAHRATQAVTNFTVDNVPDGFELIHETSGNIVRSAIGFLRFDDVVPASERAHDPATLVVSEFRTFDGLVVVVRTSEDGADTWATFEARLDGVSQPAIDEETADPATTAPESDLAVAEAKAEEISTRCDGWIFKLGDGQAANLRKTLADLIKPIEPPAAEDSAAVETPSAAATQPVIDEG